jgi:hypothetical protein
LDQFFDEVDVNHDGEISFEEWRCDQYFSFSPGVSDQLQGFPPLPTSRPIQPSWCIVVLYCYGECQSGRGCQCQRHFARIWYGSPSLICTGTTRWRNRRPMPATSRHYLTSLVCL